LQNDVLCIAKLEITVRDLNKALADIDAIKKQVARGTLFRGYGPATIAVTGLLALVAAAIQAIWLDNPREQLSEYFSIWVATAAVSVALIGAETVTRSRRLHSGLADEMIYSAIEQLIPVGVAGALLTFVLLRFSPDSLWMMPGLWQILFSLGIFASCRILPRALFAAGAWYLSSGLVCIAIAAHGDPWSPWLMAIPFGIGQLMIAGILHHALGAADGED
jgi:hypothetical protein